MAVKHLYFFKPAVWTILFLLPLIQADFKTFWSTDLSTHPSSLLASQTNFSLHSSPSFLYKIIHQNDFHLHAQPSKTGASNLHRIIHRLGHFSLRKHPKTLNSNHTKASKEDKTNTHIPSSINNNARLKRQLEGIFHVRGTPTIIPIIPSSKLLTKTSEEEEVTSRNDQIDVNRNNRTQTAEKEIVEEAIQKTNHLYPSTTTKNVDFTDTDVPRAIKDKRNFTVEIVEISRKTLFKQDSSDDDQNDKVAPTSDKTSIDSKASLHKANFLKPSSIFNPTRPRLTFRKFRPQSHQKILDDSQNSQTQTAKSEQATTTRSRNSSPEISKTVRDRKKIDKQPLDKSVEVNVSYQEHIPYNERDIDESDLKDYLDGHSTFGAKGDFKHTVSRNVSGFLPNGPKTSRLQKNGHEVYKRTPAAGSASSPRSRVRGGRVSIEQANVKQMNNHPRTTVYSASGPNQVSDSDEDTKSVYQYQANRETTKKPESPKDPSSLHELFRRGHPGILEAPKPIYKSHPLGEPYGPQQDDNEGHENPFRANPLVDEPPLKFDPESDRFYGEPLPEKDKRLAQSNRPEPVRVENAENQTPEYQEEDRTSTTRPKNDQNDDRYNYQRDYEPNDYDYEKATDIGDKDTDPYIRDFVSLDSNFDRLPRPSSADESFRSLVPEEAEDEETDRYFEPDRKNSNKYRNDDDNDDRRTDRDSDEGSTRRTKDRREDDEQYNTRAPSRSRSNDDYRDDDYNNRDNSKESYDENENPSEAELEKENRDDFDPSYVDSLSLFDEEIKRIQDADRRGVTTGNPTTATREPPLVITSPGPVVPYPTRGNIQRPTHSTTPMDESRESRESDEREEEQTNRPDQPNQGTEKSEEENGDEEEEEEDETEAPEENQQTTTSSKNTNDDEGNDDKDAEGSRQKQMKVKIERTSKNVTTSNKPDDKSGNLDDDIISIEKEFTSSGKI